LKIRTHLFRCLLLILFIGITAATATTPGKVVGGSSFETPSWFKDSFLEIANDVDDATESGKHVLLFFHLNGCPYCAITVNEQFQKEPLKSFIQEHFDSIEVNVRGDREIAMNEETTTTERVLAQYLGIQGTPTIILLNSKNQVVLRLAGYRSTHALQIALEYVQQTAYLKASFSDYKREHMNYGKYQFIDNPLIETVADFSSIREPVALLFEDDDCEDCEIFHRKLISRPASRELLERYRFIRIDAKSENLITDFNGRQISPREWTSELKMDYRPGLILFDEGKEVTRVASLLFPFHFETFLMYGLDKNYQKYTRYGELGRARQEVLFAQGIDADVGRPDDW
jgi:thioredoxin-related protein